jgi:RNA recognition motif-containing protein
VFVANLPLGFTDEQLAELFDPYGMVLRAYLVRDPQTGETQGHGLVELAPERAVQAAIDGVSAVRPGGRRVDVRRADATMCIVAKRPPRSRPGREDSAWSTARARDAAPGRTDRDPWSKPPRFGQRPGPTR